MTAPSCPIESLNPGEATTAVLGINFCDSTQAANFQLWYVVPTAHGVQVEFWAQR